MKKQFTLIVAFVVALALNSCGGSDDDNGGSGSSNLVGTWKYVGSWDSESGFQADDVEDCDDEFYKFSSNHTGKLIEKFCGESDEVANFKWQESDGSFVLIDPSTGEVLPFGYEFSEDGKRFTWFDDEGDRSFGDVYEKQ